MEHHWKNRSSFWRMKPLLFHCVKENANRCCCFDSDKTYEESLLHFNTEKSLVSKILKRVSWWSCITLIKHHWTLCVGVGKKNDLLNLCCTSLWLWVSWVTARQNNFGCWVSPEDKNCYSATWNWSGSKALPAKQSNGTTLILVPLQWEPTELDSLLV